MAILAGLPDPGQATTFDGVAERLRALKIWAGDPSYEVIKGRVNASWTAAGRPAGELARKTTVVDCFRAGRRRLNTDLVAAIVQALHPDPGYVTQWRQALAVIDGRGPAAAQVRVRDTLPQDLPGFTGRTAEVDRLREAVRDGGAVLVSAVEGMAGVGKTQLVVHAGHRLAREFRYDRVLFVDLRGFHPDRAQPPADPAAVLDGFLHLLGVPGQQIPLDLDARAAAYRERLAGTRTLIVLDNAATAEQVGPLLPDTPGCPVLITSRRRLDLDQATHLMVDVFTPAEAARFLADAAPGVPAGDDPGAATRIAARCGHLPLALGLVAGHLRAKPDWTLTDHAARLDDRHESRRLDGGVELALDLSYEHLAADRQRLLRLLALHPGADLEPYAAAALADIDLDAARTHLDRLADDHLLQRSAPGRYTFHDLVRAYASARAHDEDRPADRRAALTRLFDHYLATATAAVNFWHPTGAHLRPAAPASHTPGPDLLDAATALVWLDAERTTLVEVVVHTATHGRPAYAVGLSRVLSQYLAGGHNTDSVTVHDHAHRAAAGNGDLAGQAYCLTNLGGAFIRQCRYAEATAQLEQALTLFRQVDEPAGHARALGNLGALEHMSGRDPEAVAHYGQALVLFQQVGDVSGQTISLNNLGDLARQRGDLTTAAQYLERSLVLSRQSGDREAEGRAMNNLGHVEMLLGRHEQAGDHMRETLALFRELGVRNGQAWALEGLGALHTRLGDHQRAAELYQESLDICREIGDRYCEIWALNGVADAARMLGRPADALAHYGAAYALAVDADVIEPQARARDGLTDVHRDLGDDHDHVYRQALDVYVGLGLPDGERLRAQLVALDGERSAAV